MTDLLNMALGLVCFGLAAVFNGLAWLFQRPTSGCVWLHRKLTIAGVNARTRMNGIFRP